MSNQERGPKQSGGPQRPVGTLNGSTISEPLYPVVLRLSGRRVLVVGGSAMAAGKAAGLIAAGARVTVVDPAPGAEMWALDGQLKIEQRAYRRSEVGEYFLVVTASTRETNQLVFSDGEASHTLVNAADDPDHCSVILPALLRHEPVVVAVSTAGTSPALAGWLRDRIAEVVLARHSDLALLLEDARMRIKAVGFSNEGLAWLPFIDRLDALLADGDRDTVIAELDRWVQDATSPARTGVGTGVSTAVGTSVGTVVPISPGERQDR